VIDTDGALAEHEGDWFVSEVRSQIRRVLKRMDLTAKSFFAIIEPGSCFVGTLLELALASDRSYMLDDPDRPNAVQLSEMNAGAYPMSNGLTRMQTHLLGEPRRLERALAHGGAFDAAQALDGGIVTFAPDDIDWED